MLYLSRNIYKTQNQLDNRLTDTEYESTFISRGSCNIYIYFAVCVCDGAFEPRTLCEGAEKRAGVWIDD